MKRVFQLSWFSVLFSTTVCWAAAEHLDDRLTEKFQQSHYSKQGADTCLTCHSKTPTIVSLFATPHGSIDNNRSPMAGLQCESCHGPQGKHRGRNDPMVNFGEKANVSAELQDSVCLGCHQWDAGKEWHGGMHRDNDVACADCHQVHTTEDPVLSPQSQEGVCQQCHQRQSSAFGKRSAHPIASQHTGSMMSCSSCHAPHGSLSQGELKALDINDSCLDCHDEKRGPQLWEHAPVTEECSLCHNPHGSVNDALLIRRPPQLCQSCHASDAHPTQVYTETGSAFVAGQSCLNCHSQIHGSNHPRGDLLQR